MKVLLINKYHWDKDGGTTSYFETARVLKENGHEVAFFSMENSENIKGEWNKYFVSQVDYNDPKLSFGEKIKAGLNLVYNFEAKRRLAKLIEEFKPDIAHLHVIYHQLSPSIIDILYKNKVPMVMTLHDYKLVCPNHMLFTQNQVCEKCKVHKYYNCLKRKCVKDSYSKSALAMIEAYLHNVILKTYNKIDKFIAPSKFIQDKCVEFNWPKSKFVQITNFINTAEIAPSKYDAGESDYIFSFGRLSREKGLKDLITAMSLVKSDVKLKIAGSGPLEDALKRQIKDLKLDKKVNLVGFKKRQELDDLINKSKAVVLPSVWYENMSYSLLEAMACGKVIIASNIGGSPERVKEGETGFLFAPGDAQELAKKIDGLGKANLAQIGVNSRSEVAKFNQAYYYQNIEKLYKSVLNSYGKK